MRKYPFEFSQVHMSAVFIGARAMIRKAMRCHRYTIGDGAACATCPRSLLEISLGTGSLAGMRRYGHYGNREWPISGARHRSDVETKTE